MRSLSLRIRSWADWPACLDQAMTASLHLMALGILTGLFYLGVR